MQTELKATSLGFTLERNQANEDYLIRVFSIDGHHVLDRHWYSGQTTLHIDMPEVTTPLQIISLYNIRDGQHIKAFKLINPHHYEN